MTDHNRISADETQLQPAALSRRRALLKLAALGAGATSALSGGAALLASQAARAEGAAKTFRIGYQKYGNFVVLKARGTLEKRLAAQGVTVQWLEFPAGPQLLEGLNAGAVDAGTVGETPPIFAQAAGVDFVYVGNEPPAPQGEAIVVPHDSAIRKVEDLRGKKVALNKGSNVHYLLVEALKKGRAFICGHSSCLPRSCRCACCVRAGQRGRMGHLGPVSRGRGTSGECTRDRGRHGAGAQHAVLPRDT